MAAGTSRISAHRLAATLGAVAVVEVLAALGFSIGVGWSFQDALEAFVATNSVMGAAFGSCGAVIAWHRPRNPIGWLFIADGIGHATTAFCAPLVQALYEGGAPIGAQRLVMTVFAWSWPWSIGLFLPLALLLFPDGRLPSPRWRLAAIAVVATAPLFALEMGAGPEAPEGLPLGYFTIPSYDALQPLWTVGELRTSGALLLAMVALVVRYRRATETQRRQLLWLVLAAIVMVGVTLPWSFVAGTPVVVLFAIPLVPVAVAVAIVRHQLLDIRLVLSRALAWLLLSAGVLAGYVALVAVLDRFVSAQVGRSAVATVVVALVVAPLLPRLQRLVDRAMYGDRGDPARVASRVGERLAAGPTAGLPGVVAAVREALRLPYVAVAMHSDVLAADGHMPDGSVASVVLEYGGEVVGELLVGLRPGERELSVADRNVLTLLAAPLAVAIHATGLSAQLQASRGQIVAAREEERRRLRRDLHDGLGPTLTGVALTADAAANFVDQDPAQARELLASLRTDVRTALADVRRLVYDLRPPALDELGLIPALRQRAEQMSWRADGAALRVRVEAPDDLPALPAAIEVAAYRIATEALTNVVRHSRASAAVLQLRCGENLDVEITDDGRRTAPWQPGVGLQAMRERAAELGGRFEAGPSASGGRVYVSLPLAAT
jgi:two-component system NarL family sensor kinase